MSISTITLRPSPFFFSSSTSSQPPRQHSTTTLRCSLNPTKTLSPSPPTLITTTISNPITQPTLLPLKKVLIPIGYGTEPMEAVIMVGVLRRAGAQVTVASVESELQVEASCGTRLVADTSIAKCSTEIYDLVALPGGMPGSVRLRDCKTLQRITTTQAEEKRLYGAICAAPAVTLLPWGLLEMKQITCHPAFMSKLPSFWAVKSNLQVSGELTTSRGPGTTFQFSVSFVERLFGESVAKEIGQILLMNSAREIPRKEEINKVEWAVDHTPRVLIPIANGSEDIEVVTIVDILRRAKVDVVVASVGKSLQTLSSQGIKIVADQPIKAAADSIYDCIIIPGGIASAERLQKSRFLKKLLKEQASEGRAFGALSSSATILERLGLLKDKRIAADLSDSVLSKLENEAEDGCRVVIDGRLITSSGLSTAIEFALAIVAKFFGHARARGVAEGLVFEYPKN